jgi:hypothetical protein
MVFVNADQISNKIPNTRNIILNIRYSIYIYIYEI